MKGTVKSFKQKLNQDGSPNSFVAFNKTLYPHVMTADIEGMKGETTGEVNVTALPAWFEIGGVYEFQCTPDDRADGGWKFKVSKIREQAQPVTQQPTQDKVPVETKPLQYNEEGVDQRAMRKTASIEAQQSYEFAITFYGLLSESEKLKLEDATEKNEVVRKAGVVEKLARYFGNGIQSLANSLERPF